MINRRNILLLAMMCLVACGGESNSESSVSNEVAAPPPNIVILFADDMGYGDIGSYGHPYNRTPNIDALASQGQRWTDFYVAAPVCSPSRGALLTGRLPVRTGLYGKQIAVYFPRDEGGMPDREITLAEMLKTVGYRTGIFGKWHLGDAKHAWPTRHGFDEWLGLPYSNDMDWVGELSFDELVALSAQGNQSALVEALGGRASKYAAPKLEYWNVPLYRSVVTADGFDDETVERPAQQHTLTKRYTEAAIEFMQRSADAPFFAYVPYAMPHTPLFRSENFAGKSRGGRYGDVIEEIDWSVGQIKQALLDLDIADNTLLIVSSDNGPWLTMNTEGGSAGLLRHGKGTTFEGGMRVPTVFWWPERLRSGVVSEIGSTLDIYATVAALVGADGTSGVDGVDLSSVLFAEDDRSDSTTTDEVSLVNTGPRQEVAFYRSGQLYAYRQGPWKVHFITEGAYRQAPEKTVHDEPQLYHLGRDPGEKFDVAAMHPEVVEEILSAVERHKSRVDIAPPEFDKRLSMGAR